MRVLIIIAIVFLVITIMLYYTNINQSTVIPLSIYVADAYTEEANFLGRAFQNFSGVPFVVKSGGSFGLAREIVLSGHGDIFIPIALEATFPTFLDRYSPGWAIAFAADEMVIAYTNISINNEYARYALENATMAIITNGTRYWYNFFYILSSGRVKVGISNPNIDPAGVRAWLVLKLASYFYANDTDFFYKRMIQNKGNVTGQHAAELVPSLVSGNINFLFIYKSSAIVKKLNYISLPPQINLGDPRYSSLYSNVNYTLINGVIYGSPIYLFITIPKTAKNYDVSVKFVIFVIKNSKTLERFGLKVFHPAYLYNYSVIPTWILELIMSGDVKVERLNDQIKSFSVFPCDVKLHRYEWNFKLRTYIDHSIVGG
jgi:molybdate/tungstate transport system substrate-binding protein